MGNNTIRFELTVRDDLHPVCFVYEDQDGQLTDGSVNTIIGEPVTITYSLSNQDFTFDKPLVTNNFNSDISFQLSDDKKSIEILNKATNTDFVGIRLVVERGSDNKKFATPDPKIKSTPRNGRGPNQN